MIFQYPKAWYYRLRPLHILWDILPFALDRVLAGEMDLGEVADYIRFTLAVEAGAVEVMVGDSVANYLVIPAPDVPLVQAINERCVE